MNFFFHFQCTLLFHSQSVILSFILSGNPWIGSGDQPEKDKHARDITFLDKYSMERWEVVMHKPINVYQLLNGVVKLLCCHS